MWDMFLTVLFNMLKDGFFSSLKCKNWGDELAQIIFIYELTTAKYRHSKDDTQGPMWGDRGQLTVAHIAKKRREM